MKNFNLNHLLRENIKTIQPYTSARDEYKDAKADMIFLDANESPFNTGANRYPDPKQSELKKEISKIKGITPEQILIGNGSDEVLDLIYRAFCEPQKDTVIILPPTYGMYKVLADLNAIQVKSIVLDDEFQPQKDKILKSQDENTKILFLCSPNNPSANSFNAPKVEELIKHFKGIVVIDEAYIDFSTQQSWLSRLDEFPNLVIIQTFSKAYGLAGLRLGLCFASEEIISTLNSIKPPYNINQLSQETAIKRLKSIEQVQTEINTLIENRDQFLLALRSIALIKKVYPTDANFILVKVDDANLRYQQLIKKGIVVRNRSNQPLCDNCLRFTVGTATENKALISALKKLK